MATKSSPTTPDVGAETGAAKISINKIGTETLRIPIVGTTPLIVNRFPEKAKQEMLDRMTGRAKPKKRKDPVADYEAALHRLKDGRYGFPALGFKAATVGGARYYGKDVSMVSLRQCLFFHGELGTDGNQLVAIEGEPRMREDVVRLPAADLRYRPEFVEWRVALEVRYVTAILDRESVLSLVDAGGMGVGVGEWRPEKKGDFGCYQIDPTRDVEVIG